MRRDKSVDRAGAGRWRGKRSGRQGNALQFDIRQGFQYFERKLARNGRTVSVRNGQINGPKLTFTAPGENGRHECYLATVGRGGNSGEVRDGETVIARWSATRAQ